MEEEVRSAGTTDRDRWPAAEEIRPVLANDWVNDLYKHLVLDAPEAAARAGPGQFFHLLCPSSAAHAPFFRRPMSIYRIDAAGGRLEFLYKVIGAGTSTLADLAPGDGLDIFGPLGRGFVLGPEVRHVALVARGVGLATLAPLAETAAAAGVAVSAVLSARSPEYMMSTDYLRSVGAEVTPVTDTEDTSEVGHVETLVRDLVENRGVDLFATCGSNRLLQMLKRLGAEYGVPGQVALEQHMGCGIGMCFCCVLPFRSGDGVANRRVCYEGPVFPMEETISW